MRTKHFILIFLIFIFAFFLRILFLQKGGLTFGYDQARDALISQQIARGDFKILGPPSSTPGLYHGVFYYYLLAPAYLLGNGNPVIVAYWIAFINALTVFVIFYLTFLLSKKPLAGVLAAFLFAISFESSQYAIWLSNPTIGVLTVALMYFGLWVLVKEGKNWGAVVAAAGLGLSIQSEVFLLYHLIPLLFWLFMARSKITKKQIIFFIITLLFSISTMVVSEFKFGFKGLRGLVSLLTSQDSVVASKGLGDILLLFLNQIGRVFSFNSYPGNIGYGGILILILIIFGFFKKGKEMINWQLFLATWLLSHATVVSVGGTYTPFLTVGIGTAVSIILGIYLSDWFFSGKKLLAVFIFCFVLLGNISMILKENSKGATIFAIQKDLILKRELAAIDYTYQEAAGKQFSVNSLTSPLYINVVWTYLYKWYGLPKYGYLPNWHGRDQVGQLDTLTKIEKPSQLNFLIIEPMAGIPIQYLELTLGEENAKTRLLEEKSFGEIRIQKRILK